MCSRRFVMKTIRIYCLSALLLLIMFGCSRIKDDLDDCPVILHLYFESVMRKYQYEDVTDRLDLYMYDNSGKLMKKYSYTREELEAMDFSHVSEMKKGQYMFVASVNQADCYDVSGEHDMNALNISLNTVYGNEVHDRQKDLYHGNKIVPIPDYRKGTIHVYDTIALYKNTNHINVDVVYNGPLEPGQVVSAYIDGNNGSFGYSNVCHDESERLYRPHGRDEQLPSWLFRLTTMQLWIGSDLTLHVEKGEPEGEKTQIKQFGLVSEILKHPDYNTDDDLDQQDIYDIKLVIDANGVILNLIINDWYVIRQGEDI